MDRFITFLVRVAALLLAALCGWWVFPDAVLDLTYGQWVSVCVVAFVILGFERISSED